MLDKRKKSLIQRLDLRVRKMISAIYDFMQDNKSTEEEVFVVDMRRKSNPHPNVIDLRRESNPNVIDMRRKLNPNVIDLRSQLKPTMVDMRGNVVSR